MSSCIEVSPQEGTTDTTQTTDSIQEIRPLEEAPENDEEHEQAESNPIATIQLIDPAGKAAAGVQPQSATEENLLTDEVENSMIEKGQIPDGEETYQMEGRLIEKGEENNERMQTKEVETVENSKTDEEKEEDEMLPATTLFANKMSWNDILTEAAGQMPSSTNESYGQNVI
ncbi:hypothetical protein Nepgr_025765 [Nepenthes gracilis]|uniref:Uncharacterized protein n=1 Tax=Nepenthes gracilis TaxID=150966 RepID=A0AAD3XZT4_NEPGR|nr:hypothetical protein Nepgr_025765 [Nepenthes gracilis]